MRGTPTEVLEGGNLKGGMFRSHLSWVRENRDEADLARLWSELPGEISRSLSGMVLATSWYPFAWLIHLDRTMGRLFSSNPDELIKDLGRYSAVINLSSTYRALDRDTNHEFFKNSTLLHRQFQDFGTVSYERLGESGGRLIHRDYPCYSPTFCTSALGYYEASIQSHGAGSVRIREIECHCLGDKSCTFEMHWS
ncbi:MAG TPA: hypothetical protein VM534_05555 [Thermoanaerobaculia bacterium]|nr:hypothetical protein [Thermoanaerobaculia bacterium]